MFNFGSSNEFAMVFTTDLSWLGILVASCLNILLGALWYSPYLFGKIWMKATGVKATEMEGQTVSYGVAFVTGFVISFVLALFVKNLNATTFQEGACVGFWAWLGFMATTHVSGVLWEKKPLKLYVIYTTLLLVFMLSAGGILGMWQ